MASNNSTTHRFCLDCSADISHRNHRALRCVDCVPRHLQEYQRQRKGYNHNPVCCDCGILVVRVQGKVAPSRCNPCRQRHEYQLGMSNPERHEALKAKWRRGQPSKNRRAKSRYDSDPAYRRKKIDSASARMHGRRAARKERLWARQCGKCGICNETLWFDNVHIDHIIPLAKGGTWAEVNLQLTHPKCNLSKRSDVQEGTQIALGQVL